MKHYRSFLFSEACLDGESIQLDDRESHHLTRVLRVRAGAPIEVLDGKGTRYIGTIESVQAKGVRVAVTSVQSTPVPRPRIVLLQAESKTKSMDLVLRMATEIGVSAIQPVFTDQGEHVHRKWNKRRLVMIEACKQCGLSYVPELYEPCSLRDWLRANAYSEDDNLRLVASLRPGSRPLWTLLERVRSGLVEVVIAVGPAGDFSTAEYRLLCEHGFTEVRLGSNVLRVETAVAYILGVVDQVIRGSGVGHSMT